MSTTDWMIATAELGGVILASFGLLRESFAQLNEPRPFGEGRFGEGPYGGTNNRLVNTLINVGRTIRLLPSDGQLTVTDRKNNAALAIIGAMLVVAALTVDLILKLLA